jgi:hypothetical protein
VKAAVSHTLAATSPYYGRVKAPIVGRPRHARAIVHDGPFYQPLCAVMVRFTSFNPEPSIVRSGRQGPDRHSEGAMGPGVKEPLPLGLSSGYAGVPQSHDLLCRCRDHRTVMGNGSRVQLWVRDRGGVLLETSGPVTCLQQATPNVNSAAGIALRLRSDSDVCRSQGARRAHTFNLL